MTRAFQPLIPATPTFTDRGLARSDRYDDVYHSASGALEQAQYVFLHGNGLPERWQGRSQFTILETGFGLGNNFLATWLAWRQDPQRSQRLHFVSFEAHPFTAKDLATMLAASADEAVRPLADQLLQQWPVFLPGIHRMEFEGGAVTLTIFFGDIQQATRRMSCQADAFYLDGFSPRVNPAMWSRSVFGQLVRMSAPGATAATWCVAAQVRRNLQDAGFLVERVRGFAFKREMCKAVLRPNLGRAAAIQLSKPVLIVGGGIAGAATAYALALRGIASEVFDPVFAKGLGAAHQGHSAVALTPLLTSDDAPRARLSRAGVLRAQQRWQPFNGSSMHICGSLVVAEDEQASEILQNTLYQLAFDPNWVQYRDQAEVKAITGQARHAGGAFFPRGAAIYPELLLQQLLQHPLITCHSQQISAVQPCAQGWELTTEQGEKRTAEQLVLANAIGVKPLLGSWLTTNSSRLQKSDLLGGHSLSMASAAVSTPMNHVVAGNGYVIPMGVKGVTLGSTYTAADQGHCTQATRQIMEKIALLVSTPNASAAAISTWFGHRLAMSDHLPVITQAQPGLWLNVGYGSYGFSWAAIAADIISAKLANEPAVLERDIAGSLDLR